MAYDSSSVLVTISFFALVSYCVFVQCHISTTLDGPFEPITAPFDVRLRGHAVDLPDSDPRVIRLVNGFEPEQISVSLSANYDSVWISWVTGFSFYLRFCAHRFNYYLLIEIISYLLEHVCN